MFNIWGHSLGGIVFHRPSTVQSCVRHSNICCHDGYGSDLIAILNL